MVTKENAMQIYNLYSQIEKTEKMLTTLKEVGSKFDKKDNGVEIITTHWGENKTVEIHIPERMINPEAGSDFGCHKVYGISISDTLIVLKSHLKRLKKALELEQSKVLKQ